MDLNAVFLIPGGGIVPTIFLLRFINRLDAPESGRHIPEDVLVVVCCRLTSIETPNSIFDIKTERVEQGGVELR